MLRLNKLVLLSSVVLVIAGCGKKEVDEGPTMDELMAQQAEETTVMPEDPNSAAIQKYFSDVVYTYIPSNVNSVVSPVQSQTNVGDSGAIKTEEVEPEVAQLYEIAKYTYDPTLNVQEGDILSNLMPEYYGYDSTTLLVEPSQSYNILATVNGLYNVQQVEIDPNALKLKVVYNVKNNQDWVINPVDSITVFNDTKELAPLFEMLPLVEAKSETTLVLEYDLKSVEDYTKLRVHVKVPTMDVVNFPTSIDELNIYTYKHGVKRAKEGMELEAAQYEAAQELQKADELYQDSGVVGNE